MIRNFLALTAVLSLAGLPGIGRAADGAKIYALQCKTCHQAKSALMGPGLAGVAGRKIAGLTDFNYSPALRAKVGTWTDAALDAFLTSPAKYAAGGRMPASLPAAPDRAAVIAYLKTQK